MEHYPVEVRQKQRPVIALIGCTNLHQAIIRSFSLVSVEPLGPTTAVAGGDESSDESSGGGGRAGWSGRLPCFHALSWESGVTTPLRKEKRSSYDGYVAEGILKSSWLHKHTTSFPAVAVLFLPCEELPSHPFWRQRELSLCVEIDKARQCLRTKSIRLLVVLVRSSSSSSPTPSSADSSQPATSTDSSNSSSSNESTLIQSASTPSLHPALLAATVSAADLSSSPLSSSGAQVPGSASFSSFHSASGSPSTASVAALSSEEPSVPYSVAMASFCRRAGITSAQLIDFYKDDVAGSVRALEATVTLLSNLYYLDEIKRIKKLCTLVKKSHPKLSVRQNFKVAYLAEFSSDWSTAVAYYGKAFKLLLGLPLDRQNAQEITCVADVINFKLCKILLLVRNQLQLAVAQFDTLVKHFRHHAGLPQQEFRHWAWLSRQYEVFAQLIERYLIVKQAILKHLHAGFYYHAAAHLAIRRRKATAALLARSQSDPVFQRIAQHTTKPLPVIFVADYYGQLDAAHHTAHPLADSADSAAASDDSGSGDKEVHLRALAAETHVDVSKSIVALLLRAYEHYISTKRSPRLALRIATEMALEHQRIHTDESQQIAHTTFVRLAQEYRSEKWWALLVSIVRPALKCALFLRQTADYVGHLLELLSLQPYLPTAERAAIQQQLVAYLRAPAQLHLPPLPQPVTVSLDSDPAIFALSVHFDVDEVPLGHTATLLLHVTSALALPVHVHRIAVHFSDPALDYVVDAPDTDTDTDTDTDERFVLPSREASKPFAVPVTPRSQGPTRIECRAVQLQLGRQPPAAVLFTWTADGHRQRLARPSPAHHDAIDVSCPPFRPVLRVGYPLPNVTVHAECTGDALVNELFCVALTVRNFSSADGALLSHPVLVGELLLDVDGESSPAAASSSSSSPSSSSLFFHLSNLKKPIQKLEVGSLPAEAQTSAVVYLQCTQEARKKTVRVQFHYTTDSGKHMAQTTVSFAVVNPINTRCSLYSSKFQSVGTDSSSPPVLVGEPCLLRFQIASASPTSLDFLEHRLELDPQIASLVSTTTPDLLSAVLSPQNQSSIWYQIKVHAAGPAQRLGRLIVVWKRSTPADDSVERPPTAVAIPIPPVKVAQAPFSLKIVCPAEGTVGELLQLKLCITNQTLRVEELQLSVKENDAFIFAGQKRSTIKIFPYATKDLSFFLVPLVAGQLPFPQILLHSKHHLTDLLSDKNQQFVFVRPNAKLAPPLVF